MKTLLSQQPERFREINYIIIHCSATRKNIDFSARDVSEAHARRGFLMAGYHHYVRKDGTVVPMRPEMMAGAHCRGYNSDSIGVCYEGGLESDGTPADTRTPQQRKALREVIDALRSRYPKAVVVGHRDLSPDLNGNGTVDKNERIKECPCFDAALEYSNR